MLCRPSKPGFVLLRSLFAAGAVLLAGASSGCVADSDGADPSAADPGADTTDDAVSATFTGDATHYNTSPTALGACYPKTIGYVPMNVAMNHTQLANKAACGKQVVITAIDDNYDGKTNFRPINVVATVTNGCPGCSVGSIDFTDNAWKAMTKMPPGRFKIQWHFK